MPASISAAPTCTTCTGRTKSWGRGSTPSTTCTITWSSWAYCGVRSSGGNWVRSVGNSPPSGRGKGAKNDKIQDPPETQSMIGTAFAQSASPAAGGGDTLMGLLPIVLMFVVMYFIMIRPQMRKAKEHKTMLEALQKGDEVIAVGILGKIDKITDNYVSVEIAPNVTIQVQKQAVTTLLPKGTVKDAR